MIQLAVNLFAISLCALLVALLFQLGTVLYGFSLPVTYKVEPSSLSFALPETKHEYDVEALLSQPLFGKEVPPEGPVRVIKPTITPPPLNLIGLIGGPQGVVIIRSGSQERSYMVGDTIETPAGVYRVVEIAMDHVVVRMNGVVRRLELEGVQS